ncbi:hypothetical protein ACO1DI_28115 [Priestia sp. 40]|uniref:hypothetical protein n=1 Tax=Priestia sp. 40 TaxID=3394459 RepID=UPI003BF68463
MSTPPSGSVATIWLVTGVSSGVTIVISFGPTGGSFTGRIVIVIVEMAMPPLAV